MWGVGGGASDSQGDGKGRSFCFDKEITVLHKDRKETSNFIDFHKEGYFLIEAKQGSNSSKQSTPRRGTDGYLRMMEKAFYQAQSYTLFLQQIAIKPATKEAT